LRHNDVELVSVLCSNENEAEIREQNGQLEQKLLKKMSDIVIDFSDLETLEKNAAVLSKMQIGMVIRTKGLSKSELNKLWAMFRENYADMLYAPI